MNNKKQAPKAENIYYQALTKPKENSSKNQQHQQHSSIGSNSKVGAAPASMFVNNLDLQSAASAAVDDPVKTKNSVMVSEMDAQQISMNENGQSFDKDMGDISQAVRLEFVSGAPG